MQVAAPRVRRLALGAEVLRGTHGLHVRLPRGLGNRATRLLLSRSCGRDCACRGCSPKRLHNGIVWRQVGPGSSSRAAATLADSSGYVHVPHPFEPSRKLLRIDAESAARYNRVSRKTLGWGPHYGELREALIRALNHSGMYSELGFAVALAQFQILQGLEVDGKLGIRTLRRIVAPGYEADERERSDSPQGYLDPDVRQFLAKGKEYLLIADFAINSNELKDTTKNEPLFQEYLRLVERDDRVYLRVTGYNDIVGQEAGNISLRLGRATSVYGLLGPKARSRAGAPLPAPPRSFVSQNLSAAGRARNRSVLIEHVIAAGKDFRPEETVEVSLDQRLRHAKKTLAMYRPQNQWFPCVFKLLSKPASYDMRMINGLMWNAQRFAVPKPWSEDSYVQRGLIVYLDSWFKEHIRPSDNFGTTLRELEQLEEDFLNQTKYARAQMAVATVAGESALPGGDRLLVQIFDAMAAKEQSQRSSRLGPQRGLSIRLRRGIGVESIYSCDR